jgi:hypothetical protein
MSAATKEKGKHAASYGVEPEAFALQVLHLYSIGYFTTVT